MSTVEIDGACHCGAITFRATVDPDRVTVCHCTDCQRLTGTAFRVSLRAAADDLRIEGQPKIYIKPADSGQRREQHFCGHCGSPLFTRRQGYAGEPWGIRWGVVRQRRDFAPTHQIWRRSAPDWTCAFDTAPASQRE